MVDKSTLPVDYCISFIYINCEQTITVVTETVTVT